MKNGLLILFSLITLIYSCKPVDEIITPDPSVKLSFSADTILFDTVFAINKGSVSKRLKVYNWNKNAVNINSISVGRSSSAYSLIIDGVETNSISGLMLRGGDSLYILVKVTIDPQNPFLPYFVTDSIVFNTNTNIQDVKLVAYGQDANYFYDSILNCNTVWTNDKPYVIYNSILIDSACTLTIEAGVGVFSHNNSFIFVKGSLIVNGSSTAPVTFSGDRLEDKYENVPGQWGGIYFLPSSKKNTIDWAEIKNAVWGVRSKAYDDGDIIPEWIISNTIIKNMSDVGILCFTIDLLAYNCLVTNCMSYTVAGLYGGNYDFYNCTFANYSFHFSRDQPAVVFSDYFESSTGLKFADLNVGLINNIIWGNLEDELVFYLKGTNQPDIGFNFNLIKTTNDSLDIFGNILNKDPKFINPIDYDFRIDSISPAINAGFFWELTTDLAGETRDDSLDIGAYEYIPL